MHFSFTGFKLASVLLYGGHYTSIRLPSKLMLRLLTSLN